MNEIIIQNTDSRAVIEAALAAAGVAIASISIITRSIGYAGQIAVPAQTSIQNISDDDLSKVQMVANGIGAWTLSADGTDGASDITVSGADAACVWSVVFGGEVIASETDNSAPYAVTLAAPVAAGTYTVRAVATDGTKTGELEIEVV